MKQTDTGWETNGYPFMSQVDGTVYSFVPDTMLCENIQLIRKHPLTQYWERRMREMDGVRFYGSNIPTFKSAELLGVSVCNSIYSRECRLLPSVTKPFRYLWICPPAGKRLNISEVAIFADMNFKRKLEVKIKDSAPSMYGLIEHSIGKAFDGQNLTRYEAGKEDAFCLLDLGASRSIGGIIYVRCNDDNYISPGDCYELFYQNGPAGWVSLGKKVAKDYVLEFSHVPAGSLLWLHNCTKGVEEQAFYWDKGRQVFCYEL